MTFQKKFHPVEASLFEDTMRRASEAAEKAAEKWLEEARARGPRFMVYSADLEGNPVNDSRDYLLDNCGFAYINFRDKRSRFYKMASAWELGDNPRKRKLYSLHVRHKLSMRQELGLAEAAMSAACKIINSVYPNSVYMTSRID